MKRLTVVLFPLGLATIAGLLVALSGSPQAAKDYQVAYHPEQPIHFNHRLHAGEMQIDCQFCHTYARRSPSSGVPPVQTCMSCHKVVNGRTEAGKADVQKLRDAYAKNEPIEWVKVHDLQDFVYYTHRAHIQIGQDLAKVGDEGFTCQDCHGPVEKMETAELRAWDPELDEQPLTMGWCLTCHIKKSKDAALVIKLKKEAFQQGVPWETLIGKVEATEHDVEMTKYRLRDCWTCHK